MLYALPSSRDGRRPTLVVLHGDAGKSDAGTIAWLANPAGFVEGTTMPFTGYRAAEDRRDLIAYLLRVTQ